jgi:hypothetical protein
MGGDALRLNDLTTEKTLQIQPYSLQFAEVSLCQASPYAALQVTRALTPNSGLTLISAKVMVRRFDGPMAFVPEGQADSSQARNAWVAYAKTSSRVSVCILRPEVAKKA